MKVNEHDLPYQQPLKSHLCTLKPQLMFQSHMGYLRNLSKKKGGDFQMPNYQRKP